MFKKTIVALLLTASFYLPDARAQNWDPSLEKMMQEMESFQKRMMEGFQSLDGADSSSFFFKFDTSFSGDGMNFFRMAPEMGKGLQFDHFFGDIDQLEKRLRQMFGQESPAPMPSDDGEIRSDDDLLPEERLREQPTTPSDPPQTPNLEKPKPQKPEKTKTARRQTTKI